MLNALGNYVSKFIEAAVLRGVANALTKLAGAEVSPPDDGNLAAKILALDVAATPTHHDIELPATETAKPRKRSAI